MKKKVITVIALLLIVFGAYQGTKAVFREETNMDSPINAGRLGIEIINSTTKESLDKLDITKVMPGSTIPNPVSIRNSKDKDLYVRITLTRYWVDGNGDKVMDANAAYIKPITKNATNWLIMDDAENSNSEVLYFYYRLPVATKEVTSNFLDSIHFDEAIDDPMYGTYKANVKLEAEAIQKAGAKDAILSQWGMDVVLNETGKILQVKE